MFYFDIESVRQTRMIKRPFLLTLNDGLEIVDTESSLPANNLLLANQRYTIALTINRSIIGNIKNVLVFQFEEFSLCRYLHFKICDDSITKKSIIDANRIARVPNTLRQIKQRQISNAATECIKGNGPPM